MNAEVDIAVVGSGFAGSLLAMIARRLGRSVVLLERGRHPRFAIGESSTPLANLLLEELARRYDLPTVASLTKWGTWQKAHPEIACGLKRGFTFYHHSMNQPWASRADRANELLVGASPHDRIADTHWYRPDFDSFLVQQAQEMGASFVDAVALQQAEFSHESALLTGQRGNETISVRARFVVDASGPRGFLHCALNLRESSFANFPATHALYTHFTDVKRWDGLHPAQEAPPYPVDDAALHHIFEGGWIWVLRFNNGITSAGVAATEKLAKDLNLAEGAPAWSRLMACLPSVREQFAGAKPTIPFIHSSRLAFRSGRVAAPGWALLPSAAGVVDPLLSTGFPLTLLGVQRLAKLLETKWSRNDFSDGLKEYAERTLEELDTTADLVGALYANLDDFPRFTALTLLYFAAASYSESMRRLHRGELVRSFLLRDDSVFGPRLTRCLRLAVQSRAAEGTSALLNAVSEAINPINVAGLGDSGRRNWYPALASDLLQAAPKLRAGREEIKRLLATSGFR